MEGRFRYRYQIEIRKLADGYREGEVISDDLIKKEKCREVFSYRG